MLEVFGLGLQNRLFHGSDNVMYSNISFLLPLIIFFIILFLLGSDQELQLVLLDTVQLCGNTRDDYFHDQPQGIIRYRYSGFQAIVESTFALASIYSTLCFAIGLKSRLSTLLTD